MNSPKFKKWAIIISCALIVIIGLIAAFRMAATPSSYNGEGVDVVSLYENPTVHEEEDADGVAAVIVNEHEEETAADNVVYSVVFNFRGYDTLGESFILIAAIAGSLAILRKSTAGKEEAQNE
ncbi:MAG: hypothetical protein IIY28_06425 [Lachnospiraceae bacterium]|nr:hypothetical protein [Lachnospiraceae bacterium]